MKIIFLIIAFIIVTITVSCGPSGAYIAFSRSFQTLPDYPVYLKPVPGFTRITISVLGGEKAATNTVIIEEFDGNGLLNGFRRLDADGVELYSERYRYSGDIKETVSSLYNTERTVNGYDHAGGRAWSILHDSSNRVVSIYDYKVRPGGIIDGYRYYRTDEDHKKGVFYYEVQFTRDGRGFVTNVRRNDTDGGGTSMENYHYDHDGRLIKLSAYIPSGNSLRKQEFSYDGAGLLKEMHLTMSTDESTWLEQKELYFYSSDGLIEKIEIWTDGKLSETRFISYTK